MPIIDAIAVAAEAVITYILPESVATAVVDGTTLVASRATGLLLSIGVPADIAAGAVTVGGDAALGGAVGAGLGAGQAALTNEDILKGALMGGAGGAVGLGFGNLAEKGIAEQAAKIFSSSTAKAIGSTLGQAAGGFTGGLASGANLKDSATMAALGGAIGAYSSSEIKAENAAKKVNDSRLVAENYRKEANKLIEKINVTKGLWDTQEDIKKSNYNQAVQEYYDADPGQATQNYWNAVNAQDDLESLAGNQIRAATAADKLYTDSVKIFEAAKLEYDNAAKGFTDSQTGLVSATEKEVEYEKTLKVASDKAAADKAVADKVAADAAKVAQDAADKAAATKAAADKVIADKAAADKAIADKAAADATAAAEKAAAEHAAAVKALEDKAAADKVISDKAAADQAAAEKVAADKVIADKAAFEKADAERPITAEKPPVYEGRLGETITTSAEREKPITVSAEKEKIPTGFGGLSADWMLGYKAPNKINEPDTAATPKKKTSLLDAIGAYPFGGGGGGGVGGGGGGTPPPQTGLTATGTFSPGSSALAQVLNQGGAGAPVFGTQEGKGKKSKWNIASLRYMGNQDKGE